MNTETERYQVLRSDGMRELLVEYRGICGGFLNGEDISDAAQEVAQSVSLFESVEQYPCPDCDNRHVVKNLEDTTRCVITQQPLRSVPTSQPGWRLKSPPIMVENDTGNNTLLIESTDVFHRPEYPNVTDVYALNVESRSSDGVITLHPIEDFFDK